ncbi:MAG TPA: hypothetical protein VJ801_14605 [Polyangia bacterium]|jgi:hypothetical protein|nr:hypothetical protein [Polyangia bacterium]
MKNLALSLTIVSAVSLGSLRVARADSMPVEGTRELRLGNSLGLSSAYGQGFTSLSPGDGSDVTLVSVSVGMGYFLAEHVEVGGTAGYIYEAGGGSYPPMRGPGLSAFLRLYSKTGNVGGFFEPTIEYQHLEQGGVNTYYGSTGDGSVDMLGFGADVGVEVFLADSWALRLSPSFRAYEVWATPSGGTSYNTYFTKFGVNWGISAYF